MSNKHYPSWRYHKNGESKVIKNETEDKALNEDWKHSPADHEAEELEETIPGDEAPDFDKMTLKELVAVLIARGIDEEKLKGKKKAELLELCKGSA